MPTATTVSTSNTAGGTGASGNGGAQSAPAAIVPFVRASQLHSEPGNVDTSRLMTASDQDLGVFDVPAYGYLRAIPLLVESSGAVGASVFFEDAPFSAIKNIQLTEPNGAIIVQYNSGYECMVANKYGGYRFGNDARFSPSYTLLTASGNFSFLILIPVELGVRDALGSLPNQNAAATFKLRLTLASGAAAATGPVYTTAPGTLPTVRVRTVLEAWDQPEQSSAGMVNQITPPAMNTTQYWTVQQYTVNTGDNTIRLTRMGNYVRNFVFIFRRAGTSRANGEADWPDPLTVYWDTRPLENSMNRAYQRDRIYRRYGYTGTNEAAGARDNGVYPYDFCHEFDGKVGNENRDLWLPTLASTRFEIQGNFANAGTLTVLTNDVSVSGSVFM